MMNTSIEFRVNPEIEAQTNRWIEEGRYGEKVRRDRNRREGYVSEHQILNYLGYEIPEPKERCSDGGIDLVHELFYNINIKSRRGTRFPWNATMNADRGDIYLFVTRLDEFWMRIDGWMKKEDFDKHEIIPAGTKDKFHFPVKADFREIKPDDPDLKKTL